MREQLESIAAAVAAQERALSRARRDLAAAREQVASLRIEEGDAEVTEGCERGARRRDAAEEARLLARAHALEAELDRKHRDRLELDEELERTRVACIAAEAEADRLLRRLAVAAAMTRSQALHALVRRERDVLRRES